MRERFISGYNDFVIPFMAGMIFILVYLLVALIRLILQLPARDRRKFFLSLLNPKILLKNIRDIICDCLLHVKIFKRNPLLGYMHASIAFGWFMLIVIGHIEVFLFTPHRAKLLYYPIFFRFFVAETNETLQGAFFFFLMDFFLLIVLSGIALAMFKRIRSKALGMRRTTKLSFMDHIGLYALWSIFPLRLLAEGFTAGISGGSFLTESINKLLPAFLSDPNNIMPTWWAYSIALGVFFFVMPFTRYMHIPTEIMMILFRNAGLKITHPRKGVAKTHVYTCASCGLCIDACPMGAEKINIKDATVYLARQIKRGNEKRIREISEKCLMCGKCTAICPVGLDATLLRQAQRNLADYPLKPDFSSLPETVAENSEGKILYFAGCMTHLTPKIHRAMSSILDASGMEWDFMDKDGGICCGRPMMLTGRQDEAMKLVEKNTALIKSSGAKTLLLSCPICYKIFKEEYKLDGIEIIHHTQLIERLISGGKIKTAFNPSRSFVYHDPCELGRGCGVYEEPRKVISSVGTLKKAAKERKESICCGGSLGSLTLSFERRKAITEHSLHNLTADNPDSIVTACPLCLNTFGRYADRPVEDIAEIVNKTLIKN